MTQNVRGHRFDREKFAAATCEAFLTLRSDQQVSANVSNYAKIAQLRRPFFADIDALEKRNAEVQKAAVAALEEAFKYAPAGSESVVANVKSSIAAAQSAYENFVAMNKQIYDTLEQTVEQTVATAQAASGKPRGKRSK